MALPIGEAENARTVKSPFARRQAKKILNPLMTRAISYFSRNFSAPDEPPRLLLRAVYRGTDSRTPLRTRQNTDRASARNSPDRTGYRPYTRTQDGRLGVINAAIGGALTAAKILPKWRTQNGALVSESGPRLQLHAIRSKTAIGLGTLEERMRLTVFEHIGTHLLMKETYSRWKSTASTRSGLEPEPCSHPLSIMSRQIMHPK